MPSAGQPIPVKNRSTVALRGLRPDHWVIGPPSCSDRPAPNAESARPVEAWTSTLVLSADRQLWAAVGADDQLWVVRVYRRMGISVDRLAMDPLDEAAGRERPHARGVPGEVGVVEEVAPLAARAAAMEERWMWIDPVLRTAHAGTVRRRPPLRIDSNCRRLDQAGPSALVDADAEAVRPSAASAPPGQPFRSS